MNKSKKIKSQLIVCIFFIGLFALSIFTDCNAQTWQYSSPRPTIVGQVPNITPASPTVAAFMKFEEVPVDNYTGVPDVSIPLYSAESLSKDVKLNIALKYHPSSIAIDQTASYTGLGWNLFAGGSIARTVKGSPDELYMSMPIKVGILQDNVNHPSGGRLVNRYYQALALQGTAAVRDSVVSNMLGQFGWDAGQKGSMDTQHDIFQYNFMGHSGRFIIKRNQLSGVLEPIKLDNDNSVKVELLYTEKQSYPATYAYEIDLIGFNLYDDLGYKYSFTVIEKTEDSNSLASQSFGQPGALNQNINATGLEYNSAYHLSAIEDNSGKNLVKFTYKVAIEETSKINETSNYITLPKNFIQKVKNPGNVKIFGLLPEYTKSFQNTYIKTQKLDSIIVLNKAKIKFETGIGRDDSNINTDGPKLNSVTVYNWYNQKIKEYQLNYTYLSILSTVMNPKNVVRLALETVSDVDVVTGKKMTWKLTYDEPNVAVQGVIQKDYWGYFSQRDGGMKEPDEKWCKTNVLNNMTLPSGGRIEFEYGSNTYSYIGNTEVTDFSIDDDAVIILEPQIPTDPTVPHLGQVDPVFNPTDVFFIPSSPVVGGTFTIHSDTDQTPFSIDALGNTSYNDGTGRSIPYTLQPGINYYITYNPPLGTVTSNDPISVKIVKKGGYTEIPSNKPNPKWLLGGGIRINKISYFEDQSSEFAAKIKKFNYQKFTDSLYSSGSLAFAKPLYKYEQVSMVFYPGEQDPENNNIGGGLGSNNVDPVFPVKYLSTSNFNNLSYIRTKGADIGYQNVTIYETGNGKTEFTYTSPIDFPEYGYEILPPFRPSSNRDFLRGILLKEKHFGEKAVNDKAVYFPILEKEFIYPPTPEHIIITGSIIDSGKSPLVNQFNSYLDFKDCVNSTGGCSSPWGYRNEEQVFLSFAQDAQQSYGWPKLEKQISKEYFYPENSNTAKILTTTQTYKYDDSNKKIIESTSSTSNGSELITNKYYYDSNNIRNRIGAIKKIETYRDNKLIDFKEILYANNWQGNASFLPKTIYITKGNNAPEVRLQFLKYDAYSNPLEAKQENGNTICYIWGYNNTQPIAIIENMNYATLAFNSVLQNYIDQAVYYSNTNKGTLLLETLENVRNALPSTSSMTGYVYKPLVGVTEVLDQRGYKTKYKYDGYNRLEETYDADNHLLSKNTYNYKASSN